METKSEDTAYGTRLTTDDIVELVKRVEEKLLPICDNKALRSRIHRAVAEYSERQNLYFKDDDSLYPQSK